MREELINKVEDFLGGELTGPALWSWVLGRLQAIEESGDLQALALADAVDGGIIALEAGDIDEDDLRTELRRALAASAPAA